MPRQTINEFVDENAIGGNDSKSGIYKAYNAAGFEVFVNRLVMGLAVLEPVATILEHTSIPIISNVLPDIFRVGAIVLAFGRVGASCWLAEKGLTDAVVVQQYRAYQEGKSRWLNLHL